MMLMSIINICICCCSSNKCYYGLLLATAVAVLGGTIFITCKGVGLEPPATLTLAVQAQSPGAVEDLNKVMEITHTVFWILGGINGVLGLCLLVLAVVYLTAREDKEDHQPFVPVQLAAQPAARPASARPITAGLPVEFAQV